LVLATLEAEVSSLKLHIPSRKDEVKKLKSVSDERSDAGEEEVSHLGSVAFICTNRCGRRDFTLRISFR
jgi:hypothetical protein